MKLLPIQKLLEENQVFADNPDCQDSLYMSIEFFSKVGYNPPWIGYYAQKEDRLVGSGAFKGAPKKSKVEIAYSTFEKYRNQGIGTEICCRLVELAMKADPSVAITARTLPMANHSTRILEKNGFILMGTVQDPEDGEVWEWEYGGVEAQAKDLA